MARKAAFRRSGSVEPVRDWASSSSRVREKVSMTSCASAMNSAAF